MEPPERLAIWMGSLNTGRFIRLKRILLLHILHRHSPPCSAGNIRYTTSGFLPHMSDSEHPRAMIPPLLRGIHPVPAHLEDGRIHSMQQAIEWEDVRSGSWQHLYEYVRGLANCSPAWYDIFVVLSIDGQQICRVVGAWALILNLRFCIFDHHSPNRTY